MIVDLNIVGARAFYRGAVVECGISIDEGRIKKVGKERTLPRSESTVNVHGKLVLPGLVDIHVHLRDMQLSYKEDFRSGTAAAAAGGFTTVFDMPNTIPPTNSPRRLREKIERARREVLVNVGFYGGLPDRVEVLKEMVKSEIVGVKVNLLEARWLRDDVALRRVFEEVKRVEKFIVVHAEDGGIVNDRIMKFRRVGSSSIRDFLSAHAMDAEVVAVERVLKLQGETGAKVHVAHVSTAKSINIIEEAKRVDAAVTCEAAPHHLLLSEKDLLKVGNLAITTPPMRPLSDVLRLWEALGGGLIDVVASDHAPHLLSEKLKDDVWEVEPGIPGLETTLPLLLTRFHAGDLTLGRLVKLLVEEPVQLLKLKQRGRIEEGYHGDVIVVDVKKRFKIDPSKFHSKARYSPFEGVEVKGKVIMTLVGGNTVMEEGEIVARAGSGSIVLPTL
jgi:dihydroorotase